MNERYARLPTSLNDKVAVVTGGAMGIGQSIVLALVARGAAVAVGDLAGSSETLALVKERNGTAEAYRCDITDSGSVNAFVNRVMDRFGRIDILVNCAGHGDRVGLLDTTDALWTSQVHINLTGCFFMMRAVLPHMIKGRSGSIVNISSISGIIGGLPSKGEHGRSGPAYAAAKAGMIGLTKWAARDFGDKGIRVNAVAPGPVNTRQNTGYDFGVEDYPIPRMGTVEDMAEVVAFLASPAAAYITGEVIKVTGGVGM
jgi:3-oxoacyl-[acyl-carrier protein] reductase